MLLHRIKKASKVQSKQYLLFFTFLECNMWETNGSREIIANKTLKICKVNILTLSQLVLYIVIIRELWN